MHCQPRQVNRFRLVGYMQACPVRGDPILCKAGLDCLTFSLSKHLQALFTSSLQLSSILPTACSLRSGIFTMDGQDIPLPLPFVVSILPLLLSSADVTLPPATLSTSVLQRHYYLSSSSDSPSSYLQATSDAPIQDAVETRRERLASTWLEDVKPSEILYSATIHEEQKLVARIKLSVASSTSDNDDGSLVLLVVYEEAASPPDEESGSSGVSAAAG